MPTNDATASAVFTNLPPPLFSNFQFSASATGYALAAQVQANQTWILQSSTNLQTWRDVATNYSTAGTVQFSNNTSQFSPQSFFRIRSP